MNPTIDDYDPKWTKCCLCGCIRPPRELDLVRDQPFCKSREWCDKAIAEKYGRLLPAGAK